ncbi:SMI1/KNR4 family protein [Sphingomonas sp. LY54]|uniref:SMI1/KNR4 family protein n=1 Tax=Sphingomonas sp. LY54 TaxID=3095343 RepID=UPI002D7873A2|nr:SMI1/KNR4 family protein [Sphingomonas sp. LY54]WRP29128.1 SMI1/KNR4 family protein [Sphingomonas sp. LY54]
MLEGRDWYRMEGASVQAIEALRATAPDELPESYVQLLMISDGGEGPLPVSPFNLCLDPAREVIARIADGNHAQPAFDGFLIFGGNGGGEYFAFDMRLGAPWPVVAIDMVAGRESAEVVASNFDRFIDLIGVAPSDA